MKRETKTRIGVVVVHHSDEKQTKLLLESVGRMRPGHYTEKIWILDNSKSEGADKRLERIARNCGTAEVSVVRVENLGYFRTANVGVEYAVNWGADLIVVCNNDITYEAEFFCKLEDNTYDDLVMVVYPDLVNADGARQNPRSVQPVGPKRLLLYHLYYTNYWVASLMEKLHTCAPERSRAFSAENPGRGRELIGSTGPVPISLGVGACFVLTNAYLEQGTRLPDDVFLFGEEALLAEQVRTLGGGCYYDSRLKVFHDQHSTVGQFPRRQYWRIRKQSARIYLPCLWRLWWYSDR